MKWESRPWWAPDAADDPHVRLMPLVAQIERMQSPRRANMRRMISIYENGYYSEGVDSNTLIEDSELHFNVAKNAIDSMTALVMAPKIAPMLMTEGASWTQRRRAKLATKAVEGVLDENNWDELEEDFVLDAQLAYCGFVKVGSRIDYDDETERSTAKITLERVNPLDVYVDEDEGRDRNPPCIYLKRRVDRYQLLDMFGGPSKDLYGAANKRYKAIMDLPAARGEAGSSHSTASQDQVEVWEAWHKPSDGGADDDEKRTDGRHAICAEAVTLLYEPWARADFPVAAYRPEKARSGFWGLAAMRYALAGQREYSIVTRKLQRAHRKMGGSHWIVGRAGKIEPREISNDVGTVIETDDINQVRDFQPTPANPQTYQYREGIADDILKYMGLSQQTAQAEVPAGLANASGKALQSFQDSENKRLVLRHRARERMTVSVTSLILEEARALTKRGISIESKYAAKGGFERIDWAELVDVVNERNALVVKTFPINKLSQDPASKFAQLDVLLSKGAITIEQFKRLFEMPDLEAENDVDCSDYEIVDKCLDRMVTQGVYSSPEPFDNLSMCLDRGRKYINACRVSEVPEDRMVLLRNWMQDVQALLDRAAGRTASSDPSTGPGGPGGSEPGPGGAPPVGMGGGPSNVVGATPQMIQGMPQ